MIDAFCECKVRRDGGCKHIATSMYLLDELLNQDGSKSVISGPGLWMPKPPSSSEPCFVDHLEIIKIKPQYAKQRKRKYPWLQNIDFDPRSPKHQKVSTTKKSILPRLSLLLLVVSPATMRQHHLNLLYCHFYRSFISNRMKKTFTTRSPKQHLLRIVP